MPMKVFVLFLFLGGLVSVFFGVFSFFNQLVKLCTGVVLLLLFLSFLFNYLFLGFSLPLINPQNFSSFHFSFLPFHIFILFCFFSSIN